jgi:hypothetical protein
LDEFSLACSPILQPIARCFNYEINQPGHCFIFQAYDIAVELLNFMILIGDFCWNGDATLWPAPASAPRSPPFSSNL